MVKLESNFNYVSFGNSILKNRDVSKKTSFNVENFCETKTQDVPLFAHKNYSNISFGRLTAIHKSWGATVQESKKVFFKLFTFTDVKRVFVELKTPKAGDCVANWKLNPYNKDGYQKFRGREMVSKIPGGRMFELDNNGEGLYSRTISADRAQAGDGYRFIIVDKDDNIIKLKDPYAKLQEDVNSWSTIYDHNLFKWSDSKWTKGCVKEKISRLWKEKGLTSPDSLRIYELNIATFTKEGTFEAAKAKLANLALDKKFNTIEIMPVENTHSINWGYDGVDKFAPQNSVLGGPDKLKELIDYAHTLKLNVIMDIVPNHLGPDGAMLPLTGPYCSGPNAFGSAFNFEGKNNKYVRDYITNSALNWLSNYHCDGLRVDMTKFMESDFTMKQMAAEVHYHHPDALLIAEDGRNNLPKVTERLQDAEELLGKPEREHDSLIKKIEKNQTSLDNLGFDSEWDFVLHKQIAAAALENWELGQYHKNMSNLDSAIRNSVKRIKYPMSHDEIGNWDGTRLLTKYAEIKLDMYNRFEGKDAAEQGQKSAHFAQKLLTTIVSGKADKMNSSDWKKFLDENGVKRYFSLNDAKQAFSNGLDAHKASIGKIYSIPGPKMVFQGDERADLSYFKFFRLFSSGEEPYLRSKGYEPGLKAFYDSKLNSVYVATNMEPKFDGIEKFTSDLNELNQKNRALQDGQIVSTTVHQNSNVHAIHAKKNENEIFSISNHSDTNYYNNYEIKFPKGVWREVINSNDIKYGGNGKAMNGFFAINNNHNGNHLISLPKNSIVFFEKIG